MPALIPLFRAAFLAALFLTPVAFAQHAKPSADEPLFGGLTEAEIEMHTPTSANPFVSFLPAGVEPDYRYWKARLALDAYRRSERRGELTAAARDLTFEESEEDDETGGNDSPATADFIADFGTGGDDDDVLTISGTGASIMVETVMPFDEDDGSITFASVTELEVGEGLFIEDAEIGNGPFGATSGDFDFYAITASAPGQTILADVDTPVGDLDPYIALYDDTGAIIAFNDDSDGLDSFLEVSTPSAGTFYLAVFSWRPGNVFLDDPFDSSSGPGAGSIGPYNLILTLDLVQDVDVFAFELAAGDILGVGEGNQAVNSVAIIAPDGTLLIGSNQDFSSIYPVDSPLPGGGIGLVGAATIAPEDGVYALAVLGSGPYSIGVRAFRPRTETEAGAVQTLFVDFDGATVNAQELFGFGNPSATLSPLSDFITNWGLEASDEDDLIDAIMAVLNENLRTDVQGDSNNPDSEVVLLNSRDDEEPAEDTPYVSRLIVGGTVDELGIETIGIASAIDPGNFGLEDTGVVLLDFLSGPSSSPNSLNQFALAPGAEKIDLVATGVGNVTAHEGGHFIGLFHTDQFNELATIIDQGGNLPGFVGVGPDNTFGSADDVDVDFLPDEFNPFEGFLGIEDQLNIVAFGLSQNTATEADATQPSEAAVAALYPNPLAATGAATLELRSVRDETIRVAVYDVTGRLVRTVFEGRVAPDQTRTVQIEGAGLATGTYLVRIESASESATRRLTIVR